MKRFVKYSIFACIVALLLCGCSSPQVVSPNVTAAYEAIENGDIQTAYDLLLAERESKAAQELLEKFLFVPTTYQYSSQWPGSTYISTTIYSYNYNEDGWMTDSIESVNGSEKTVTYTYDENGNLSEKKIHDEDGSTFVHTYTYDESGHMLTHFHPDEYVDIYGSNSYTNTYSYDKKGNISSIFVQYENGDWEKYEDEYNKNNDLTREYKTSSDGNWSEQITVYDKKGYPVSESYKTSDGYSTFMAVTCDENGNIIKGDYQDSNGTEIVYIYHYDENGNLIETYDSSYSTDEPSRVCTYDLYGNTLTVDGESSSVRYEWQLMFYPDGVPNGVYTILKENISL